MGIAAEAGACGYKASRAQSDASGSAPDLASAGHGPAFGDDKRLVLRFLELSKYWKYHLSGSHDGTLRVKFCTACSAGTQDSLDIKPCVRGNCTGKLSVAVWHQAGIGPVRP